MLERLSLDMLAVVAKNRKIECISLAAFDSIKHLGLLEVTVYLCNVSIFNLNLSLVSTYT